MARGSSTPSDDGAANEPLALIECLDNAVAQAHRDRRASHAEPANDGLRSRAAKSQVALDQAFDAVWACARLEPKDQWLSKWRADANLLMDDWLQDSEFALSALRNLEWASRAVSADERPVVEWDYGSHGWARAAITIDGTRHNLSPASAVLNHPIRDLAKALCSIAIGHAEAPLEWAYWHEPDAHVVTLIPGSNGGWRVRLEKSDDWWPGRACAKRRIVAQGEIDLSHLVNDMITLLALERDRYGPAGNPGWHPAASDELKVLKEWRRRASRARPPQ